MDLETTMLVPWIPLIGALLCGLCATRPGLARAAGPICVLSIAASFALSLLGYLGWDGGVVSLEVWRWIEVGTFRAGMSYDIDGLTWLMLFVVTGVGTLIALYATGYMAGDRGYARFFAAVALFIFAMTTLVMADNLVLLYLGWEGVGFCSYLLIGYYYEKRDAVAAAKKAFIVNRVGDLGFALGIFLTYLTYNTVDIGDIVGNAGGPDPTGYAWAIPYLLMLGAFGKSAQLPLHTWLPDAMAGPTPVSALVHAATMVTAGVYMIARLFPVFELSPFALPLVALVGGVTALFAATIALCQYDLKKVFAYSTVSQLGYMFLGVGAFSSASGVFHLFTHAFFKALLFLTAGSVMHAMAGQLDLRKMSGLRRRMPVTAGLMLVGCLALAGFPFLSGFFSKDAILAAAFDRGGDHDAAYAPLYPVLGALGLVTAFLTAFYTFRLWFRVFTGPEHFEMGDEHHGSHAGSVLPAVGDPESRAAAEPAHAPAAAAHGHGDHPAAPHEMPWWPMNLPLVVLALGALAAGYLHGWVDDLVAPAAYAEAADHAHAEHDHGHESNLHTILMVVSGVVSLAGIALAWYFHLANRAATDRIAAAARPLVNVLHHKYYVDELYDYAIVLPLRVFGYLLYVVDALVIHVLAVGVGWLPRLLGYTLRPTQGGRLQGYGLGMVAGVAVVLALVLFVIA